MRRGLDRSAALLAWPVFVIASCGGDESMAGKPCSTDAACGSGLACMEGICAASYDDPGGGGVPLAGPVRLFAVGLHPVPADVETQETFRASIRSTVDTQVVPNLAADRPNLVVFPEDTGLIAVFIGERGAAAREAPNMTAAMLELGNTYGDAGDFYLGRAGSVLGPGRLVSLVVTDALWRSLEETFAAMAAELGVWIAVTYNVADAERTTDPELVRALVDESVADRSHAWVAVGDDVFNQTLVYDPTGALVQRHRKEYLVPLEESGLELTYGPPGGLRPAPTPFGDLASVISKDAWMPDVLDRLALGGARLMLQPEAFSGWGVPHGDEGSWAPDVVKESGWAHVMRVPELRANVLPCLSANLFGIVFDCQSAILVDPALAPSRGAFIGQDPDAGFARVAPWVADDDGMGTLDERRARLVAVGERLLPGSGAPEENAYAAGTVWMDVDLGAHFDATSPDPIGDAVADSPSGEQRRPAVAVLDDDTVLAVWEDTRAGQARIYGVRAATTDPFRIGEARVRVPTTGEVRAPRIATRGQAAHLVWQEQRDGTWAVRHAVSNDGGRSFSSGTTVSQAPSGVDQWVPDVAVSEDGAVHVVWVDGRDGAMRIYHAVSRNDGRSFDARAVEAAPPGEYNPRQNRWGPSVAARAGTVATAWTDFRSYRWEIWGALSHDDGETFEDARRLDDADVAFETIHSDLQSSLLDDGTWLLAWTDLRVRKPDYDVRVRRVSPDGPGASGPSLLVAASDTEGRPQWRPSMTVRGLDVMLVWQDFRGDRNELRFAASSDGGVTFGRDEPVAGASASGAHRFWPRVATVSDGRFAVAFESTGTGGRRVRLAVLP